ncbi:MAG: arsenosugar biosynthesis radical SAM (seleno)protein ArsS [Pseudomonadota bacterium]
MDTAVKHDFNQHLRSHGQFPLKRSSLSELQINLGYLCNLACTHCHVEAGPKRTEIMTWETMERIIDWARENHIRSADLTGGAPEMIPHFRDLVDAFIELGIQVTSRCNLTVLFEPNQEDLAEWYAERKIRLVCSLPCYTSDNVDRQRGKGVFGKSINALNLLNDHGYARQDDLTLDLVYNPIGPSLPPAQAALEADYKKRLKKDFDIDFNGLLTITNLPVRRFAHFLRRTGQLESYQQLLADNFNPSTVAPLMCRHLISVDWQGYVYDCDFNQMEDMPAAATGRKQLWEVSPGQFDNARIAVGTHCFGCTAGAGSSCGGALT